MFPQVCLLASLWVISSAVAGGSSVIIYAAYSSLIPWFCQCSVKRGGFLSWSWCWKCNGWQCYYQGPLLRSYETGLNFGNLTFWKLAFSGRSVLKISLMCRQYGNSTLTVPSGMWQGTLEIQSTLQFHVLTYTCQTVNFYGIPDPWKKSNLNIVWLSAQSY